VLGGMPNSGVRGKNPLVAMITESRRWPSVRATICSLTPPA